MDDMKDFYEQYYASQIDFRYNRKTGTYSVLRLNADPSLVLYKDGRSRKTTEKEIARQLKELTA